MFFDLNFQVFTYRQFNKFSLILYGILFLSGFVFVPIHSLQAQQIPSTITAKTNFCIQTFNIFGPIYASNRSLRIKLFGDYIQNRPCDILQLQEVWTDGLFSDVDDAINSNVREYAGFNFNNIIPFGETRSQGHIGLATFTQDRLSKIQSFLFPVNFEIGFSPLGALEWIRQVSGTKKAISVSKIRVTSNEDVYFVNTHTHPHSASVRIAQMFYLISIIDKLMKDNLPIIISGDFNAGPNSEEMNLLKEVLGVNDTLNWSNTCTYCLNNPNYIGIDFKSKRFDYILYISSIKTRLTIKESLIEPQRYKGIALSDHYGVRAYFNVNSNSAPLNINFNSADLSPTQKKKFENIRIKIRNSLNRITDKNPTDPAYDEIYQIALSLYSRFKKLDSNDPLIKNLTKGYY